MAHQFFAIEVGDREPVVWWDVVNPAPANTFEVLTGDSSPKEIGVSLRPMKGSEVADATGSTGWIVVVSDAFCASLQEQELTGWNVCAIDVLLSDDRATTLNALQLLGRASNVDVTDTRLELRAGRKGPESRPYGVGLQPAGWDGSDLFMVEGKGYILCTATTKRALERDNVSNVRFTPSGEIGVPLTWERWIEMGGSPPPADLWKPS